MFDMQWQVVYVWGIISHAHSMLVLCNGTVLYGVEYAYRLPIREVQQVWEWRVL